MFSQRAECLKRLEAENLAGLCQPKGDHVSRSSWERGVGSVTGHGLGVEA